MKQRDNVSGVKSRGVEDVKLSSCAMEAEDWEAGVA